MRYGFAGFEAGTREFTLARAGRPIEVAPKPLRLLLHLLSRAPASVSVEELSAVLWPNETVTSNSLVQAVRLARMALGPHGAAVIRTVRGRGYRIGVPVERHPEAGPLQTWATEGPFVGRAALLATLERVARAVLAGSVGAILLAGEPGIGKTRTVEVLCESDVLEEAEVVWGRSVEGPGAPPLHPWLEIIERLVRRRSADVVRELMGQDLPLVASVSEPIRALRLRETSPPALEADQQRFRLLQACASFFRSIARDRPLVVVLDDLHHADALSLALWEHVVRSEEPARLLLVGTYRHVAAPANPALERAVSATASSPCAASAVTLGGLDPGAVGALLETVGGGKPASEDYVEQVHVRTGGNPLFIRALARGPTSSGDEPVPETVAAAVRNRLALLEPGARVVLEAASVIGREFDIDVVAGASRLPRASCLAALDEAFGAGLVTTEQDGLRWRFVHMVVGEVLYSDLPPGRRATLHAAVARALQLRFVDAPDRIAGIVAEHFRKGLAAEAPETVLRASIAAAEVAERSGSFEEATQHREIALAMLDRVGQREPRVHFENLLKLARNHGLLGQHEARLDAGRRALALARELGAREIARAAIAIYDIKRSGMAWESGVDEILEEALTRLPEEPSAERAHLLALKAHAGLFSDLGLGPAREQARRAVEMARRFGGNVLRETLCIRHYVLGGPDDLDLREDIARELAASTRTAGSSESVVMALIETACDRLSRGDAAGADLWYRTAVDASGSPPFPAMEWSLGNYRAAFALMQGDYEKAERISLETWEIGTRVGQIQAPASRAAHMMTLSAARGDPGYAADLVDVVLATSERTVMRISDAAGAEFSARAGRLERAAEIVASVSGEGFRSLPRNLGWTPTMVRLAHAVAAIGNERWAAEIHALLEPVDSMHGVIPGPLLYWGSVAGARARLLELLGRREEAAHAYERAIAAERALGALPWAQRNEVRRAAIQLGRAS